MIRWTEVRILVPQGWQELVAERVCAGPCTSAAFGRSSLAAEAVPEGFEMVRAFLPDRSDTPEVRAAIEDDLAQLAALTEAPELDGLRIEWRELPPEDYANSWKKSWKPFRVGRLLLLPPWKDWTPRADEVRLTIQPGGAFGSGRHATTRTCLRALSQRIAGGERVLDAGSGSGVLSVAAALLGAESCLGFDVDANAAFIADELAQDNGVASRCEFRGGDFGVLGPDDSSYDVVLANIYSDIIQAHAADLSERLAASGWFMFSGCPDRHAPETRAAIEAAGLRITEERPRGRWYTFIGRKADAGS
ncbi:MAG: 50S ribosomal protein L11 methyltransferase [Planctomycetes bacterium]|nr:50S ribosomal protein L11 methyltransferase [Planctomycetota bacterium]MCB9906032.1 50S ribosomal protein L11 methyltransferase [Planctomycetota bacterium]